MRNGQSSAGAWPGRGRFERVIARLVTRSRARGGGPRCDPLCLQAMAFRTCARSTHDGEAASRGGSAARRCGRERRQVGVHVQADVCGSGFDNPHSNRKGQLSPLNLRRIKSSKPGGTWRDWDAGIQAVCHRKDTGATFPSVYGRMEWDRVAPTITTQCFGYGNGRFGHPEQDRAISLREAAMLQTFLPTYAFTRDDEPVRFNKMGRLIGNAVPVRLGEVIAGVFQQHLKAVR